MCTWISLAFPWLSVSSWFSQCCLFSLFFSIFIHVCLFFHVPLVCLFVSSLRSRPTFAKMNTCFSIIFAVGLCFIHIYFCHPKKERNLLLFLSAVSPYFSSVRFFIWLCLVYIFRTAVSIALRFTFYFFPFFGWYSSMFGMSMTIILLLVTCLLCCSFVYSTILFLFVVASIVRRNLLSRSLVFLHSQTVKCRVYLTLSWESKNVCVCMF